MPKLDRFKLQSAQRLRAAMTDEERILWRHLWRIPVEGTHFRRQASVGIYFPDFISHRLKLIIEVDGAHHSFDGQQRHDERRTNGSGARVIASSDSGTMKTNWIPCSIRSMRRWKNENHTLARETPKALDPEMPPPHPGADAPTLPIEGRVRSYRCPTCF
ncbi:endonuclease domain-containing protein [Mesorhizobium opportunistum]|uniref:endonuclease domain-containing protein n=1 Tax=Mesorhizobium opportunistum TaxID=593909 RepID=UPI003CC920B2